MSQPSSAFDSESQTVISPFKAKNDKIILESYHFIIIEFLVILSQVIILSR